MNEQKVKDAVKVILSEIGEDVNREGIKATPERVVRMYKKVFDGYDKKLCVMNEDDRQKCNDSNIIPITVFKCDASEMLIRNTQFQSFCEHHMVNFSGIAYVGIIPDKLLLGMNKIDKIVKYFSARLQIQERLTSQIADWIQTNIKPRGVIVVIKANHLCAELQGDEGDFTTSAIRGVFKDEKEGSRQEFMRLITK